MFIYFALFLVLSLWSVCLVFFSFFLSPFVAHSCSVLILPDLHFPLKCS